MEKTYTLNVGGQDLVFKTGKVAKQANAAVVASHGETTILTTACMSDKPRVGLDFFPLLVDFEERYYAAGKIPGGYIKREGRPSQTAILSARVVDRSIRSLFDDSMRNDVHVVATVLAVDQKNPANILAINAASVALTISNIPWGGPVGAVRMGCIGGELVVNPTEEQMAESTLDLTVAGHAGGITMVEAGAKEVPEELLVNALQTAQDEIKKIVAFQLRIREEIGQPKTELPAPLAIEEIDRWVKDNLSEETAKAVMIHGKKERGAAISALVEKATAHFADLYADAEGYIAGAVEALVKSTMRTITARDKIRADGRATDEIRPISCEVNVLPKVHGSALFTRGETQALVVTTLGMLGEDDQIIDGLKLDEPNKRFLLHYNFPPYSVGEIKPMRGPGRREIGHGALAERALAPLVPGEEEFPYVVRVVSDILESNGSSSQASICGGSLSMMAAGVPMKKHVAGIAMGLIKEGDDMVILTDIQGLEDHYGDMDFKVAGTRDGVTALQMDNKAGGITREVLSRALMQAHQARMQILDAMEACIPEPAPLSPNAPRIFTMNIDVDKIRDVIGPGGKIIRNIVQESGAKINVEDDGSVYICAVSPDSVEKARRMIHDIVREVEAGEAFYGTVTRLMAFGAFVEVLPGKEGLLHISEISTKHIGKVEDVFAPGDHVIVEVKEIDDQNRINLSRRRLLADPALIESAGLTQYLPAEEERDKMIAALPDASAPSRDRTPRRDGDRERRGDRGPFRRDRR
ncbi:MULTISPECIES: polyribonucleotide nucleotidyltransferase [unclassified Pyramidobacter]|uniref:polyribonucleotide nucleotidyltransferase n=1 Tax=unclassified Pyramidobacter TaxID=2632171 RepID=UPI000EA39D8A|nr:MULTISPECIES: polyribonucleotide nucleotidyltransferase [unclassified Pyramidobacter]MCI7404401.1 polyribonucleotide nucleotidyltransferase [Pyramidobacter sp.]MDY3213475.1 polyribonucleotide nucleotidyltransferase [Pyramidobacter sp.]RKJ80368.1 polyribonucleotide nucleotidyltransferase [Pyramidobacter sp. CG50-2]WOL41275.1 polyribonucleotide nucleotidyltransferase [Pyramidobacter sp. YE332]